VQIEHDFLFHFCGAIVGTAVIRAKNYYGKRVRNSWTKAQYNGFWGVEINLSRIIDGEGWKWWIFENWDDLFSVH
jgi:hypothetical protein